MSFNYNKNTKIPLFRREVVQNFPFIEEDFDALTDYGLISKIGGYLNKCIINVDNLDNDFKRLVDYVNNYLDNINIQDDVSNKLEEMAQNGELTAIMLEVLELGGILAYDTLNDLKNATNIVDGSFTRTYAKDNYNDGYGAFYKIRSLINTDVVDNDNLVPLVNFPTLIAEKMKDSRIDNIESSISNIEDSIENIDGRVETLENNELTEMVIFGDSWSDPEAIEYQYGTIVGDMLNLNVHNYAKSGATYVTPTYIGTTEYQNFLNDTSYDKSKIKYIILMGGINDYKNSHSAYDVGVEINDIIYSKLRVVAPQAKILVIFNCEYPYSKAQSYYWYYLQERITTGTQVSTFSLDALNNFNQFTGTLDYYHYSYDGQAVIASNIIALLTGGEIVTIPDIIEITDGDDSVKISYVRIKNIILYSVAFTNGTSNTNYKRFTLTDDRPAIPYYDDIGYLATSYSGNDVYMLMGSKLVDFSSSSNFELKTYNFTGTIIIDNV